MRIDRCKKEKEDLYLKSIINSFNNQYYSSMIEDYMSDEFEENRESYRNILMIYGIINDYDELINKMFSFSTLNRNKNKIDDEEFHTALLYLIYLKSKNNNYILQEELKKIIIKKLSLFGRILNKNKIIKEYNKSIRLKMLILRCCNKQIKIQKLFISKGERLNAKFDRINYIEFLNRNCMMIEIIEQKYLIDYFKIKNNKYNNKFLFIKGKKELLANKKIRNLEFKNEYINRVYERIAEEEKIIEYVLWVISIVFPILIFLPR